MHRHSDARTGLARIPLLLLVLLGIAAGAAGAAPASGDEAAAVVGPWLSEKKKLMVEFYRCKDELCGRIVWLAKPYKDGALRRDEKNPDPALRGRPWCGIEVIHGLEADGDGVWEDGKVYDPKRGKTYDLEIKVKDEGRLKLRAYMGIKLLGESEVWTRPAPGHELGCVPTS